jgi:5-methylcytosine-specific restriction endonuclease McrA
VFARDHGVCASCGIDTEALRTALISLWRIDSRAAHANAWIHGFGNTFRSVRVGRYGPRPMSLWQADHIRPVVEGGGECGLENYRTLCLPCHHRATAELMRRRRKTTEAA